MMAKKKIFVVFLSLVFTLVGLNSSLGSANEYVLGEIPTEPVTIDMWMISGTGADWINECIALYKEDHPNVDFNMTIQSDEFIDTNVITTLGIRPKDLDITFFWSGTRIHRLVEDESVLNLDPWYEYYGWDKIFHDGAYSTNYVDGFGHAAFNYGWYAFTPFYNKVIFAKVGVTPPKTMDEYWKMCEKIKEAGYEVMTMGGKDAWPLHLAWNQMIGRYLPSKDAEKLNNFSVTPGRTAEDAEIFRSEGAIKTWQFMADMKSKGYFSPGVNSLDWLDSNDRFASGKAAMIFGFIPFTLVDARAQDPDFPVDYFIMPDTDVSDGALTVGYNDVFVIPANVAEIKKPIIADFLNRILTDKECINSMIINGINPSSKTLTVEEIVKISEDEELGRFFEEMEGRPILHITDVWLSLDLIKEYYNDLMEVTEGIMSPEEAGQYMYELALEEVE